MRVLVEHSGRVVSKDELFACIWPDTCVSESNLKVQIAALRRALGEGRRGERYVATVSGRGYRFVAPVKRRDPLHEQRETAASERNLVPGLNRPLGIHQIIDALRSELTAQRFIAIVGPNGIGKTTAALALANLLAGSNCDGLRLVELAALRDSDLVPNAIAALSPGIPVEGGAEALPSMLRQNNMLIVLDFCQHLATPDKSTSNQSSYGGATQITEGLSKGGQLAGQAKMA
ncbi:MAG: winged helix-turn-helix domain-containing protein [Candidatus Eremiobacteraeota bacterium]|nr:winged helix-turn-helix domain-containing protein [Candidatus Eremiobacteraeota bacterium]